MATVITCFFVVFLLIGNLLSAESTKQSFRARFYSRSLLQITNALIEANLNLEKYLSTRTPIYIDNAYTKLSSASALVVSFLGATTIEELPEEFIENYKKAEELLNVIIVKVEDILDEKVEPASVVSNILSIQEDIKKLTTFSLSTEGAAWRLRLADFSSVISSEKFNKISLNILSVFIFVMLIVLLGFILKKKKYDRALEESRLHFLNTARLMSLGEFSATVAHEINNPLSILLWRVAYVEKLEQTRPIDPDVIKSIASMKEQAVRIDKIIKGIKLLSTNANSLDKELVSVKDLIFDFHELIEHRLSFENIKFKTDLSKIPNVFVFVRPVQLVQVFMNFLNNSIEAISSLEDKWIAFNVSVEKRFIKIHFIDSGLCENIPNKDKIFDLFYTSKKSKGTGLGLGVSRQIVESYEGELVLNEQSSHTEFILTLPIYEKGKS